MNTLWRSKLTAFSIHVLFSVAIISIFMWLVTQLWFPDILFSLENVWEGLQILIPVDAILGPLLTLILFVPGKKGLFGDILIIAFIQIIALVFGGLTIYNQRPEVIVFAGDRFEIITSKEFDRENFAKDYFHDIELTRPFIVYSLPGQNEEERTNFVLNNIQYQRMSERYRPISNYRPDVIKKALSLSKFVAENDKSEETLKDFKAQHNEDGVLLFILEGTTKFARILVLDNNLKHVGYLDLNPWTEYKP